MHQLLQDVLTKDEKTDLSKLLNMLSASPKRYFLRNEILQTFSDYCQQSQKPAYFFHSSSLGQLIDYTHELILENNNIWLVLRPWIASQQVWRLTADLAHLELMTPRELLDARDRYVNRYQSQILEIDLSPFYKTYPSISDPRNIGQGLEFLNRHLCSKLLSEPEYWLETLFDVLHRHQYDGVPLMIGDRMHSGAQLLQQIRKAIAFVDQLPPDEPYQKFHLDFQELGFEPGWGNTASRVGETLELLDRLLNTPEPAILEAFVSRIPSVFRVVLISIHGWVGQESVLGRPETTGQVIYVLEQARSLEKKLSAEIKLAGLDLLGIQPNVTILTRLIPNCEGTACSNRLEKIEGINNGWILRVPFRFNSHVTQNWISKFEIWPYLETFALDAEQELLARMGGSPNLIIGNYSDGNLVGFLLARRLKVTQCNIAHSLEKPKYLFGNLYWQDFEPQYHFSAQFAADLIGMNAADFIITSSQQEIVGTPDTMGQYESYKCFTMPGLYHVINGVELFSPKFNRVPPGVNEAIFFPYHHSEQRNASDRVRVRELLFSREEPYILGHLKDSSKRPILAIASINSTKNITGLVECFGKSYALQERCNLIFVTTKVNATEATNPEEAREIEKLHELVERYSLHGHIRWIGMRLPSTDLGEAYRAIADSNGVFVHFALFESFGRVILEAMISGLPTFATQFGGALEIIEDGKCGFAINPTDLEGTAEKILDFIERCDADSEYWHEISERGIQRVHDDYNWQLHTNKLLLLAKISSFWNYIHRDSQEALLRYLEALFYLIYKPRADRILEHRYQ